MTRDHKAEWQRRNTLAQANGYTSATAATKARQRENETLRRRHLNERDRLWKIRLADIRAKNASS